MTRFSAQPLSLVPTLLLSACVATPHLSHADAGAPPFRVAEFFVGHTEGNGVLRVALTRQRGVRVNSFGRRDPDGTLVVDQSIREQGRPVRTRTWRMREVAPGRYVGTLSDAASTVSGLANGNRLHLRFRARGGLDVEQWLTLAHDGRAVQNILVARKFGIPVAALDERIERRD